MSIKKFVQTAYQRFKQAILGRFGGFHKLKENRPIGGNVRERGQESIVRTDANSGRLRIKRLYPDVVLPTRAHPTDAGLDLVATSFNRHEKYDEYGTGLAIALPPGTVGLLFPRSSISNKDAMLSNSVGVIDQNFRGEIKARFRKNIVAGEGYKVGEKIMQLVVVPCLHPDIVDVQSLEETDRGAGGFGSSGS